MLILVDCRPLLYAGAGKERTRFILSVFPALQAGWPVEWLFLVDQTWSQQRLPLPEKSVLMQKAVRGRIGWRFWYGWRLPAIARKHKVDGVMLTGGVCAARLAVPQILWMPEAADIRKGSERMPFSFLYVRKLIVSLRAASVVFCFSEKDRVWLAEQVGAEGKDKIKAVKLFPSEGLSPLGMGEREAARQSHTAGKEYFFVSVDGVAVKSVITLLKAFSLFKKRQLSNMQLILAGKLAGDPSALTMSLDTYKYRQDVHRFELAEGAGSTNAASGEALGGTADSSNVLSKEAMAQLRSAAYALLLPWKRGQLGQELLDGWKTGVPVLINSDGPLQEMAGEAAGSASLEDSGAFAAQLMNVYKDERFRAGLIEKGFQALSGYEKDAIIKAIEDVVRPVIRQ